MKWPFSLRARGRLSAAGERIELLLLSTVNGQRPDNFPRTGLSLRTGKFTAEIKALGATRLKPSFGMMI